MGVSRVTNGGVKVIGKMPIIRFDAYENKQDFKRWLQTYGEEVKREKWIWFGENVDKDARARERAASTSSTRRSTLATTRSLHSRAARAAPSSRARTGDTDLSERGTLGDTHGGACLFACDVSYYSTRFRCWMLPHENKRPRCCWWDSYTWLSCSLRR